LHRARAEHHYLAGRGWRRVVASPRPIRIVEERAIKTLLRASDVLADHIQAAQGLAPPVDEERSAGLVHELELLTHGGEAPPVVEEDEDDFGFVPMAFDVPLDEPLPQSPRSISADRHWHRASTRPTARSG